MLFDFWYPAMRSDEIRGKEMHKAMLLDTPLVLGRNSRGEAFALRDACPHRGIPLSCGWFDGATVDCCYHGWKFDPVSGQCQEIPSLHAASTLKVDRIYATAYPCEEHDGYVWVYMSAQPAARNAPDFPAPRLPVFSERYVSTHLSADLPCHVDHGIIGLMDPAHGPFVHQSWWWRSRTSIHEKTKQFEPIPGGFRMSAHAPSTNSAPYKLLRWYANATGISTTIDFVLPNLRLEQIRAGNYWFSSMTTVTPVTSSSCRIDVVSAWNLFRWMPLTLPVFRWFGKRFIRQDQRTMEMQAIGLKHQPNLMLIDDADRPAKWYFQLKAAHEEAKRTGEPAVHPLTGPVTLRWRS